MKLKPLVICAMGLLMTACVYVPHTAPVSPPPGLLFQETRTPLTVNYDRTPANPSKTGTSRMRYLQIPFTYGLLSFTWENGSLEEAAANGNIQSVAYADYSLFNVLGIYQEMTIHAYGE